MNSSAVLHKKTIPQEVMLVVLNRCDETREFMAQVWLQNPHLAKQGGRKAAELISSWPTYALKDVQK